MINDGVIGCGFVGGAFKTWLEENNKDVQVLVSDPSKKLFGDECAASIYSC